MNLLHIGTVCQSCAFRPSHCTYIARSPGNGRNSDLDCACEDRLLICHFCVWVEALERAPLELIHNNGIPVNILQFIVMVNLFICVLHFRFASSHRFVNFTRGTVVQYRAAFVLGATVTCRATVRCMYMYHDRDFSPDARSPRAQ